MRQVKNFHVIQKVNKKKQKYLEKRSKMHNQVGKTLPKAKTLY